MKTANMTLERSPKGILILTPFFSPNVGGAETHFDDLVMALDKRGYKIFVQTYSPLTTGGIQWRPREEWGNVCVRRYRWFGKNLFHKIDKYPFLDFLYLTPYLAIRAFLFMLQNHSKIDVIHAQGLNAVLIGWVLKKIFSKKLIASTHAVYELDKVSKTAKIIKAVLNGADQVLCLSKASMSELVSFGIDPDKLSLFKYWINLDVFKPMPKKQVRDELNLKDQFTVLFVGRLIEKKGIKVLMGVAKQMKQIQFIFIGTGPEERMIQTEAERFSHILFRGMVENVKLCEYYNAADIFCLPSQYEEGFGRVGMEAVACGIPVVGANKGGIPEALDKSVALLVEPTVEGLHKAIESLYIHSDQYLSLKQNCSEYAHRNFSENNIALITEHYERC
ncbi:MAG: glycosyltransferase family 4 protein [Chlamydiae bacterium]|nr:glycosyltransferase family 4 protein [Chlamydiota bacterium]